MSHAFTLTELLVVMGVIAILAAVTAVSYRGLARDAKLSSAQNTVAAVLDNARGLAIKNNTNVLVVFRPRLDGKDQYVEAALAQWKQSGLAEVSGSLHVVDRFVPIPGIATRRLGSAVKIAGPAYGGTPPGMDPDSVWITQTHHPARNTETDAGEYPGYLLGIMYAADGTVLTRNPATDSSWAWVDFNNDTLQRISLPGGTQTDENYFGAAPLPVPNPNIDASFFEQRFTDVESYITMVPFIAVFDDDESREFYDTRQWDSAVNPGICLFIPCALRQRLEDYTEYITSNAERIHFNRYTGVVMK